MQANERKQAIKECEERKNEITNMLDLERLQEELNELDQQTYDPHFWDDANSAQKVVKEVKQRKQKIDEITAFQTLFDDIITLDELIELDESMLPEFIEKVEQLKQDAEKLTVKLLLNDENDSLNAIIEIHPGAGGTESQDWAEMLFRMYKRYGERQNYQFELIDYLAGDEAGIKSVTFSLSGDFAYGYLKSEHGVHRLVRISPFDSGGRRHTSFASINIIPEIDDQVEVDIQEKDLKIDTYRSSGAGGQSVNTTDSAVRITHLPTKTVVTVQNERSQIKNREKAMQILRGKLYQLELQRKQEELDSFRGSVSNSFGSQIRSYVMHPYSMVKDHRTNEETGNVQKVLDGDLDAFISAFLTRQVRES